MSVALLLILCIAAAFYTGRIAALFSHQEQSPIFTGLMLLLIGYMVVAAPPAGFLALFSFGYHREKYYKALYICHEGDTQ